MPALGPAADLARDESRGFPERREPGLLEVRDARAHDLVPVVRLEVQLGGDLTRQRNRDSLPLMGQLWGRDAVARHEGTAEYGNISVIDESPRVRGLLYVGTVSPYKGQLNAVRGFDCLAERDPDVCAAMYFFTSSGLACHGPWTETSTSMGTSRRTGAASGPAPSGMIQVSDV